MGQRLAQGTGRQELFIAKAHFTVDDNDFDIFVDAGILQAVVH